MTKKGIVVLIKDGKQKASYAHRNSQLRSLGRRVVKFCRDYSVDELKTIYDGITLVNQDDPMTSEQREAYKKYMPEETWTDDFGWVEALKYTKDVLQPLRDGYPFMVDYSSFIPALRCRWQYFIDLDNGTLSIYKHGLEVLNYESEIMPEDRTIFPGHVKPALVGSFPLAEIPENWVEVCELNYRKKTMILVD